MAIASSDIKYKLTTKSGSAGNSLTSTPAASLGKYISTSEINLSTTMNNLFDNITGDENAASTVDYRCFAIHNNHATLTWQSVKGWIYSEVSGGASIAIALDDLNADDVAIGASAAQAKEIANETTAPSPALSFSTATTKGTGITVGDIRPGYCRFVWVRRTAANTGAKDSDGATLRFEGDSAE